MELIPGQLYRAISTDDVVELEPPQFQGLKLLIIPKHIKCLKSLQKAVEKQTGKRPDLTLVLNAMLFAEQEMSASIDECEYISALANRIDELKQHLDQHSSK